MKKLMVILAMMAIVVSCGNDESKSTSSENKPQDLSQNPDYQKGLDLIAKSDCLTCHKPTETSIGPAYSDVAKKYAGQPEMIDTMAQRIIRGSTGHWGDQVMTPHSSLSEADAKAMAKYVLLLINN